MPYNSTVTHSLQFKIVPLNNTVKVTNLCIGKNNDLSEGG